MRTDISNRLGDFVKFILRPLVTMPIRLIVLVIPKDESLWIFGCYTGKSFDGNSKHFFEYVRLQKTNKKLIVITHSDKTLTALQSQQIEAYKAYSIQGLWLVARASKCFITNFVEDDLNILTVSSRLKVYSLWHGIPLKSIRWSRPKWLRLILNLVRWQIPRPTIYLSTYNQPAIETPELFHLKQEQIKPFGYPRNDLFFAKKHNLGLQNIDLGKYKQIWSYLPTFRDVTTNLKPFSSITLETLDAWLEKNKTVLLIKNHPVAKPILVGTKRKNIIDISDQALDTQFLLQHTDVLITDYSSVCIDFALTKRPCLYYIYDFEDYQKRVGFGIDFLKVLPGPFIYNEQEFMQSVHTIDKWSQTKQYKLDYQAFLDRFYLHQDGKSAQRLLQHVLNKGYY